MRKKMNENALKEWNAFMRRFNAHVDKTIKTLEHLDDINSKFGDIAGKAVENSPFGLAVGLYDDKFHQTNEEYYEWQGKHGYEKHGKPTMAATVGVLGTAISLGTYGVFAGTAAWTMRTSMWNAFGIAVNVGQLAGPNNKAFQYGGLAIDLIEFRTNPVSTINLINYAWSQSQGK